MGVRAEVRDGIRYILLDHPKVNALGIEELKEMSELIEESREKVLVLKSTQKIFSAGLSVEDHLPERVGEMLEVFSLVILSLMRYPGVTVAVVNRGAYGGGTELAFACDIVAATRDCQFSQPEIQLAVFPPVACALYPFLMPASLAREMVLGGDNYGAEDLHRLGVVQRLLPNELWEEEAHEYLQKFTRHSAHALKFAKKAFLYVDLVAERLHEANRIYLEELMKGKDPLEGLRAFLERRNPVWQDE